MTWICHILFFCLHYLTVVSNVAFLFSSGAIIAKMINRNLFCQRFGDQESAVKVLSGCALPGDDWGEIHSLPLSASADLKLHTSVLASSSHCLFFIGSQNSLSLLTGYI